MCLNTYCESTNLNSPLPAQPPQTPKNTVYRYFFGNLTRPPADQASNCNQQLPEATNERQHIFRTLNLLCFQCLRNRRKICMIEPLNASERRKTHIIEHRHAPKCHNIRLVEPPNVSGNHNTRIWDLPCVSPGWDITNINA